MLGQLARGVTQTIKRAVRGLQAEIAQPPAKESAPASASDLWLMHPKGQYLLERGGREIPPPITAGIALTNKCNLRCEICGSQKSLDDRGSVRRHSELDLLRSVAETVFPVLITVELNSQGDPLLSPHIEEVLALIRDHKCELKVQTNGTLFSDRIVDLLISMTGEVNISLDAVGPKFDEVRRGGVWSKAEPGILNLLNQRDPSRLKVGLYPTLTRRTIGEVVNVIEWAGKTGIDYVTFHRYDPLAIGNTEEAPTPLEYERAKELAAQWCDSSGYPLNVMFEGQRMNREAFPDRKTEVCSPEKQAFKRFYVAPSYPTEIDREGANPNFICDAPNSYIDIGLSGEAAACCRAQEVPIGLATSVEEFSKTWFGYNYKVIRNSLRRSENGPLPLMNCEQCIGYHAPKSLSGRKAVDYGDGPSTSVEGGLELAIKGDVLFEHIRPYKGGVYCAAYLSPGIDSALFDLVEDATILRKVDELASVEAGTYFVSGRKVYFKSTDGKDPRLSFSGKHYAFRPKASPKIADA